MAVRVGRGIALPYLRPRYWRWGWGVSTTPRSLYPRERSGTHCTGDGVGPQGRFGRVRKISPPTGIRSPDRPARSESLYRLSYPGRTDCSYLVQNISYPHFLFEIVTTRSCLFFGMAVKIGLSPEIMTKSGVWYQCACGNIWILGDRK